MFFRRLKSDNSGKIRVPIILLSLVVSFMLMVWTVILVVHFGSGGTVPWQWPPSFEWPEWPESWEFSFPSRGDSETPEDDLQVETAEPTPPIPPTPPAAPVPPESPPETPLSEIFISISKEYPDINRELNNLAEQYGSAAVTLTAYDLNTREFFTYQYGYADIEAKRAVNTDTKFFTASLSKLVTAICVMILVDEGHVALDADVSNYFGYEFRNPNFPDTPITARMLMQHMSSVFDSGAFQQSVDRDSSESVKYLIERGTSFRRNKPGTNFEYSNFGYSVLGALCERVSGQSLDTFARENIFEPLGIDAAYVPSMLRDTENIAVIYDSTRNVTRSVEAQSEVEQSDSLAHDLHLAYRNLTISSADYAKILAMLGGGGTYGNVTVLSKSSVNEINKANVESSSGYMQGLGTRFTEEEYIWGDSFYWHTGSSYGIFSQYVYNTIPARGVVVITSGASVNRLDNSMIDACTAMSEAAWGVFEYIGVG